MYIVQLYIVTNNSWDDLICDIFGTKMQTRKKFQRNIMLFALLNITQPEIENFYSFFLNCSFLLHGIWIILSVATATHASNMSNKRFFPWRTCFLFAALSRFSNSIQCQFELISTWQSNNTSLTASLWLGSNESAG